MENTSKSLMQNCHSGEILPFIWCLGAQIPKELGQKWDPEKIIINK
jgi:hypothetical protein